MNKDLYSLKTVKKVLRFTNFFIIGILAFLVLIMVVYNVVILCSKANVKSNDRITDYGKIGSTYLVQVKTDNWKSYFPQYSLLFVHSVNYTYEELVDPNNIDLLDKVYLVRIYDGKENSYVVGKIISKVEDAVVISGDKYVSYNDVVGVVDDYVPIVAIFNNEWFLFTSLLIIAIFVGLLLYFTSLDLGYDIMVEEQIGKELKKDVLFGLKVREKKIITSEEIVENFISNIISGKANEDDVIPKQNVINALKVIDAKDFDTKEKVFVYFASLNLLNSYVKKKDCAINNKSKYIFKKFASEGIDDLSDKKKHLVSVYGDSSFCMVNCMGMEFSFHNLDLKKNYPAKEWAGLKLQPYANAIFELFFAKEFANTTFNVEDAVLNQIINDLQK